MVSKTLFLVLVGVALALATPAPNDPFFNKEISPEVLKCYPAEKNETSVQVENSTTETAVATLDETKLRTFEQRWDKLKVKLHNILQKWSSIWEELKKRSIRAYYAVLEKVKIIKDSGEKIIEAIKSTYRTLMTEGKSIYTNFKCLYQVMKQAVEDIKDVLKEGYRDAKDLLSDLKLAVDETELMIQIKGIGKHN